MAARAMRCIPDDQRQLLVERMLAEAETADAHRLAHGRPHPRFGVGSLMGAASRYPHLGEAFFDDPDYCRCWIAVLSALRDRLERSSRSG